MWTFQTFSDLAGAVPAGEFTMGSAMRFENSKGITIVMGTGLTEQSRIEVHATILLPLKIKSITACSWRRGSKDRHADLRGLNSATGNLNATIFPFLPCVCRQPGFIGYRSLELSG